MSLQSLASTTLLGSFKCLIWVEAKINGPPGTSLDAPQTKLKTFFKRYAYAVLML